MGFSHHYWMLLACATFVGIGNNLWHPTAIPWLADRFPERKGLVMSVHGMGGNVGDALAPLAVGLLLQIMSWRNVVLINVLPGIAMSAFILIYVGRASGTDAEASGERKHTRMTGAQRLRALTGLLADRAFATLAISSCFRAMTQSLRCMTFLLLFTSPA